ncbi:3-oxoacyl-[acyl-carrier-protein] reductase [Candidatus Pelagibacter sp.]|jgi:3-oxoacyl-[acyl-carrier protein] reductase|nr:3-oxoacyl-[acyl-carrier-protein] reductase [Candidatus Pelagibacter sp.]
MSNLKNKNIIVTGASGGIGNSIVERLHDSGANILATGTRVEKLEELKKKFDNIKILKFDISEHEKIEEFVDNATEELGGSLDCIINNAGITKDNLAIRMNLEEWTNVININLTSTFLMCKYSIKKMLKNKAGKIINITSVVGHTGNVGQANYTASKAGIVAMSKSLAIEYAKKNINVNCISPGFISTAMTDQIDTKYKEAIIAKIPSNRLGKPKDIANAVVFLSSDQSDYINGETLHVNGGMYLG